MRKIRCYEVVSVEKDVREKEYSPIVARVAFREREGAPQRSLRQPLTPLSPFQLPILISYVGVLQYSPLVYMYI
jgi:hypothetical protein